MESKIVTCYTQAQILANDNDLKLSIDNNGFYVIHYREINGRDAKNIVTKCETINEIHCFLNGYVFAKKRGDSNRK